MFSFNELNLSNVTWICQSLLLNILISLPLCTDMAAWSQRHKTEPIKPLRSFSYASHRDLKGWWQMVVNSQDVFLEPAAWSWGKPKKQQKYNNIATTHLHSCTAKRGSYARAQVTIVYIWCITKGCQGTAMFWMAYLSPEHSNYPINILCNIFIILYICACEKKCICEMQYIHVVYIKICTELLPSWT